MKTEQIKQWVKDAVADGWAIEPTYDNQSIEKYAKLKKDDFKASISIGTKSDTINLWDSKDICIEVPEVYSMESIKNNTKKCHICNATNVETVRMQFAIRCCSKCKKDPKIIKKYEYHGWTN